MRSDRRFILTAIIAGLFVTSGVFQLVLQADRRVQLESFASVTSDRASVFEWTLTHAISSVDSVAALYAASQEVEPDEFEAFAQRLLLTQHDIEAIAWLPRESADETGPDRQEGANAYPVRFVEPRIGNESLLGFDCAAVEPCAAALEHSRSSGQSALTDLLNVSDSSNDRLNVVALLPIYHNDLPRDPASRQRQLPMGYAAAFIDIGDVWGATSTHFTESGIDVAIYGSASSNRNRLLYAQDLVSAQAKTPIPKSIEPSVASVEFTIAGTTWQIVSSAGREFLNARSSGHPWIVLAFGLLTTTLIGVQLVLRTEHTEAVLDSHIRLTEAHDELDRQRRQLRQIIDLVPQLIFVRDDGGRILLANRATADACGTSVSELIDPQRGHLFGARLDSLGTLDEDEAVKSSNEAIVLTDVEFVDIDERTRVLNAAKIPYSFLAPDREQQAVLCVAVDVTDIRDVEADKARLEAELRHSQKMESIGVLAGGIAHDFNNLLGSIIGNTELAASKTDPDGALARNLHEVLDASEHASRLVSQILTFSRKEELRLTRIDAAEIVHSAIDLIRPSLPSTVELRRDIDPMAGTIMGDQTQITQVVINLCTNAYQSMNTKEGVLEISLHVTMVDDAKAAVRPGLEPGPHVRLRVRDTGCGMDENTLQHLFDPFFTTKGVGEGTGLGLSVVHGIISSHGGRIFVESQTDIGTTFTIYLPSSSGASYAAAEAAMQGTLPLENGGGHILLVDDDVALLQTASEMLEMLGYIVTAFSDAREALEAFAQRPDDFDAVVTDQAMPTLTGMEMARDLIKIRPGLPIVVATGFSEYVTPESAQDFGLRGYVSKPYRMKDLGNVLRDALGTLATVEA